MRLRLIDANALYNGTMKEEYFGFKAHDEDGRESFAYSCAMQRLADAPTIAAIPVEWLKQKRDSQSDPWDYLANAIDYIIAVHSKEQEAQDG